MKLRAILDFLFTKSVVMVKARNQGHGWDRGIYWWERFFDLQYGAYLYLFVTTVLSLVAVIGSVYLLLIGNIPTGTALIIAVVAFITYTYNAHFNRRSQIEQMTRQLMALFRDRRDFVAKDSELLTIFAGEVEVLTVTQRSKVESFLYSLFDAYLYGIYLIRWGYLDSRTGLYLMLKNMIAKSLALPYVIEIWDEELNREKIFQNEYPEYFVSMVDEIIQKI